MSKQLIAKIAVKLAADRSCILRADQLPTYWSKTPSNLAYRLRLETGWNIRSRKSKKTGKIYFERFPSDETTKQN